VIGSRGRLTYEKLQGLPRQRTAGPYTEGCIADAGRSLRTWTMYVGISRIATIVGLEWDTPLSLLSKSNSGVVHATIIGRIYSFIGLSPYKSKIEWMRAIATERREDSGPSAIDTAFSSGQDPIIQRLPVVATLFSSFCQSTSSTPYIRR
jgi:hypothetical protein